MAETTTPDVKKRSFPPRAIASILFGWFSLAVLDADLAIGSRLGRLSNALESAKMDHLHQIVESAMMMAGRELATIRYTLALFALIFCVWAWRRESCFAVGIAVVLTSLALAVNLWMHA